MALFFEHKVDLGQEQGGSPPKVVCSAWSASEPPLLAVSLDNGAIQLSLEEVSHSEISAFLEHAVVSRRYMQANGHLQLANGMVDYGCWRAVVM